MCFCGIKEYGDLTLTCRDNVVGTAIALDGSMTTAFATFSVCSRLRNAQCARRIGLVISLSEKEPSSRRIEGSPTTSRGGARVLRLHQMVMLVALK